MKASLDTKRIPQLLCIAVLVWLFGRAPDDWIDRLTQPQLRHNDDSWPNACSPSPQLRRAPLRTSSAASPWAAE